MGSVKLNPESWYLYFTKMRDIRTLSNPNVDHGKISHPTQRTFSKKYPTGPNPFTSAVYPEKCVNH